MYLRDFQITMRKHDFAQFGQARHVWEPIELRLCRRIPKRFMFGNVKKVVIQVGPEPKEKPYQVLLDVGVIHYPKFEMSSFLKADSKQQILITTKLVRESFADLSQRFKTPIPWVQDELEAIDAEQA